MRRTEPVDRWSIRRSPGRCDDAYCQVAQAGTEADAKLQRLYDTIENGVTDLAPNSVLGWRATADEDGHHSLAIPL